MLGEISIPKKRGDFCCCFGTELRLCENTAWMAGETACPTMGYKSGRIT